MQQTLPPPRELILEQLDRMLASDTFAGAERSRALLRFLVEHVVENRPDRLKEYTIGSEALGRGDSFDPRIDPIVRAEASRLRSRIERYYATTGVADSLLISLPKGSYVPQLQSRAIPAAVPPVHTEGAPSTAGRLQRLLWFVLGGITVGAAVMLLISMRDRNPPAADFGGLPFDVKLGTADQSLGSDIGNDVIISPDGTRIVFVALGSDHVSRLMTLRPDGSAIGPRRTLVPAQGTIVPLQQTEGARAPFFSPDSRWVGFWADGKLKMVSVDGGSPIVLTDAISFGGATWGEDGYIIAAMGRVLRRVSSSPPGEASVVADLTNERVEPRWPHLLPGSKHVLFTAVGPQGPDASNIEALSLEDRKRTPLVRGGFGRYFRDGYLLYVNQGTLYAVPFDPHQPAVTGNGRIALEERVAYSTIFGHAKFDLSSNGTLIYRGDPLLVAAWLDRSGPIEPLLTKPGAYTFPRLSRDGQHLAINVTESGVLRSDVYNLRRPTEEPKTLPDVSGNMSTVWHPAGFLVLGSSRGMSWMKTGDFAKLETLTASPNVQIPWSFNADGTRLAYAEASPTMDLWTIPITQSDKTLIAGKPEPFLTTTDYESFPSFSPDGRWMLYGRGLPGRWNVYVQPFPPDASKEIKISQQGGRIGRWLSNGRELVYRTDNHRLMVVGYQVKNGRFTVDAEPKEWTPQRLGDTGVISNFDVQGDRVLGLVPASREEDERIRNHVTVMPGFAGEVRRLFGGGK